MNSKFKEALSFFQKGQLNESKKLCLEILKEDPKHVEIYNLYAIVLLQLKKFDLAIENWNIAIKL